MADHKENVQYRIPSNKIHVLKEHGKKSDLKKFFYISVPQRSPIQVLKPLRFYLRTCRDIPNKKSTPASGIAASG
jgi:hypothetical protein